LKAFEAEKLVDIEARLMALESAKEEKL